MEKSPGAGAGIGEPVVYFVSCAHVLSLLFGDSFAHASPVTLRVMTYNIKGHGSLLSRSHIEKVAATIRDANPDIIGLQEVHRRRWQSRRRDQAAELERLTGLNPYFGRSLGDERASYGNAILTRGEIVDAHVERLPGRGEPRSLLMSTIELDGFRLQAYVTHFAAWGRFGSRSRLLQAKAVATIVAQSQLPFVLAGDFNSNPTSEELRVFHDGDLVSSCFVSDVVTHRATKQCLDYIFVDRRWLIRDAQVVRSGPSDHWPLVAVLERDEERQVEARA